MGHCRGYLASQADRPEEFDAQGHGKLSDQESLLILDSCEHMLAGVAQIVRRLREAVPSLAVLVTSQEPLDIDGEQFSGCSHSAFLQPTSRRLRKLALRFDRASPGGCIPRGSVRGKW